MKNKKKIIFLGSIFLLFFFNIALSSEEINYSSNTIKVLENGKIISGEGDVQISIGENILISSEKFEYNRKTGLYKIFNNVKFIDKINNIKASGKEFILSTFDNKILSKTKSKIFYDENYDIDLENFEYDITDQKINSDNFVKMKEIIKTSELIKKSDIIIIGAPHTTYKNLKIPKNKFLIDSWGLFEK